MYRKPLLTVEDGEALLGKLVRFEFHLGRSRWVGVVTRLGPDWGDGIQSICFALRDGSEDSLRFLNGANVVFATTADDMRINEDSFVEVAWRDRHTLAVNAR